MAALMALAIMAVQPGQVVMLGTSGQLEGDAVLTADLEAHELVVGNKVWPEGDRELYRKYLALLAALSVQNRLVIVPAGTLAEVVRLQGRAARVRVIEGEHVGWEGWIESGWCNPPDAIAQKRLARIESPGSNLMFGAFLLLLLAAGVVWFVWRTAVLNRGATRPALKHLPSKGRGLFSDHAEELRISNALGRISSSAEQRSETDAPETNSPEIDAILRRFGGGDQ